MKNILSSSYDNNNVFAKILRKEIETNFIFENNYLIVIRDINPIANTHILIIPKESLVDLNDLIRSKNSLVFFNSMSNFLIKLNLKNYKLQTNNGKLADQQVMHLHFHIISNETIDDSIKF